MNPLSLQGLTPRLGTSLQLAFVYPDWLKERMSEACNVSFANHDVGVFVNLSVDRIVRNCPKAIRFLKLEAVLYPTTLFEHACLLVGELTKDEPVIPQCVSWTGSHALYDPTWLRRSGDRSQYLVVRLQAELHEEALGRVKWYQNLGEDSPPWIVKEAALQRSDCQGQDAETLRWSISAWVNIAFVMFKRILWVELVARLFFGLGEVFHWQLANLTIEAQVYHCEMFCCLPGNEKMLGLKWSPEQARWFVKKGWFKPGNTMFPTKISKISPANWWDKIPYRDDQLNFQAHSNCGCTSLQTKKKPPNVGFATQRWRCSSPRKVAVTKTCLEDMKTWMSERLRASIDIEKHKNWTTSQGAYL